MLPCHAFHVTSKFPRSCTAVTVVVVLLPHSTTKPGLAVLCPFILWPGSWHQQSAARRACIRHRQTLPHPSTRAPGPLRVYHCLCGVASCTLPSELG